MFNWFICCKGKYFICLPQVFSRKTDRNNYICWGENPKPSPNLPPAGEAYNFLRA